jgi:glycine/D-amino acid oxidase-like deaminating enzyme
VTCLYTNTPDEHFVIDVHPRHPEVLLASACSGHGFKFSAAIGEALAELVLDGRSQCDLRLFSATREALRAVPGTESRS